MPLTKGQVIIASIILPIFLSLFAFKVYNDHGTTAAGSGVSVASGTAQIVAMIVYRLPVDCPRLDQIAGRPTRTT